MFSFEHPDKFSNRHIGPGEIETEEMLKLIGVNSLDQLINDTVPEQIRLKKKMDLDDPLSESDFITDLKEIAAKNKVFKSYIGMGYYPVITPSVILRNVLENPGWYTQYTPYQAEISQGRLEALLNFQTMISDLTSLPIANASLLDEATAAAEAMLMCYYNRKNKNAVKIFVAEDCFPQTIDVLKTRSTPVNIELVIGQTDQIKLDESFFAVLVQYPNQTGKIDNYTNFFEAAGKLNIFRIVAADIMSLTLLTPPGEFGADIAVGSTQRFGVPMGFGGPHAAYFAAKEELKRVIPGRIIGISVDAHGNTAYRMALQTREQHIRREKATSNICTAQVLLAVIASMYAVYHGAAGIKAIAKRIHNLTLYLNQALSLIGVNQLNKNFFDTLLLEVGDKAKLIREIAEANEVNFRYINNNLIGISISEKTDLDDVLNVISIFTQAYDKPINTTDLEKIFIDETSNLPAQLIRKTNYLQHTVFNSYHSETEMLRYLKSLENKDLSLVHSMTPLGSCTMKLNATTEMMGITWNEFSDIHPFAPSNQTQGYQHLLTQLENDLKSITGFNAVSLQPNSGAQGEYTGLMVIREYHKNNGQSNRNVVLIPSSAHGTNPASAVMAGMKVVVVACDSKGNIDLNDLKSKAEANRNNLAALMVTYPSTHGVFEDKIKENCNIIHQNGGQVYMDGANMNAQVGLTNPAEIGADVCHLNLHKTFCIPHGGGGPGVGPIAVAKHLTPYLPGHSVKNIGGDKSIHAVSAAPFGSADILIISYAYIKMMGEEGLTKTTKYAILNANYIKSKLEKIYPVLYVGEKGRVAHELIFDMQAFKNSVNVEVEDIAKRLMDYGFHAPTVSFPVHGTLMVEPTESESKAELDRFCEAMIEIRNEIAEIETGASDTKNNVFKNSPHTAQVICSDNWQFPYSREQAAFPLGWVRQHKFWPAVSRVNNAYGDRNLVCTCAPINEYVQETN